MTTYGIRHNRNQRKKKDWKGWTPITTPYCIYAQCRKCLWFRDDFIGDIAKKNKSTYQMPQAVKWWGTLRWREWWPHNYDNRGQNLSRGDEQTYLWSDKHIRYCGNWFERMVLTLLLLYFPCWKSSRIVAARLRYRLPKKRTVPTDFLEPHIWRISLSSVIK